MCVRRNCSLFGGNKVTNEKTYRLLLQVCMAACVLAMVASSGAAGGEYAGKAVVHSDSLAVHSRATEKSKVVKSLRKGDRVSVELEVETEEGSWCGVVEESKSALSGYVRCRDLERKPASRKWKSVGTTGGAEPAHEAAKSPQSGKIRRPVSDVTVKLYMTSWCPYCKKAREYLKTIGVNLIEYDIEADNGKREEMRAKGGTGGVPFIDIEGIIVRGYSEEGIRRAIERRRSL